MVGWDAKWVCKYTEFSDMTYPKHSFHDLGEGKRAAMEQPDPALHMCH